jgi:hypothetical protein
MALIPKVRAEARIGIGEAVARSPARVAVGTWVNPAPPAQITVARDFRLL